MASTDVAASREDMHVRRAEIVIVMTMAVRVIVAMVVMVMLLAKQEGADEIDGKPEHGNGDGFAIGNRDRVDQPLHALEGDLDRDDAENDGAGEGGEIAELAGAEGEMRIARLAARKEIGERGDAERSRMGRHMPAIGKQRHRAEQRSRHDLADHHDRGQRDHKPGTALVAGMF